MNSTPVIDTFFLNNFWIRKQMLEAIVHMSAHLGIKLFIHKCEIETKDLEFNPEIKFKLSWIRFDSCFGCNQESKDMSEELEDILKAISNSKLKTSLKSFWFSDRANTITKEDVENALKRHGLDEITIKK